MSIMRSSASQRHRARRRLGMHAGQEQHFGFVDVANAGDDALIEQRLRDRAVAAGDDAADRFVAIERRRRAGRGPAAPPGRASASCCGVTNSATGTLNATATQSAVSMRTRIACWPRHQRSPWRYRCHDPFMRMCVRRIRSPLNLISRCLPADSHFSMMRPTIGVSTLTRSRCAYAVSNRVTAWPASTRCSDRAARNIVSPSGIVLQLPSSPCSFSGRRGTRSCSPIAVEVKPASSRKWLEGSLDRRLAVDLFDQPSAPAFGRALRDRHQLARHRAADARALGLIIRHADDQLPIAAADPRGGAAVDDDDPRAGGPSLRRARSAPPRSWATESARRRDSPDRWRRSSR